MRELILGSRLGAVLRGLHGVSDRSFPDKRDVATGAWIPATIERIGEPLKLRELQRQGVLMTAGGEMRLGRLVRAIPPTGCALVWLVVSVFCVTDTGAEITGGPQTEALRFPAEKGPIMPLEGKPRLSKSPQGSDLAIGSVGFANDGRVTYTVENRGNSAANSPFVVDILINGERKDTVKHDPLPPLTIQRVHSTLARPDACNSVTIRVVADSQSLVTEHSETNNTRDRNAVPPCPDLVVKITKDSVNNHLEYRAKVKVTNKGNLSTRKPFTVILTGGPGGGTGIFSLPVLAQRRIDPLAPGESKSFYEGGKHWGTTGMNYFALADRFEEISESDEGNNDDKKSMGP